MPTPRVWGCPSAQSRPRHISCPAVRTSLWAADSVHPSPWPRTLPRVQTEVTAKGSGHSEGLRPLSASPTPFTDPGPGDWTQGALVPVPLGEDNEPDSVRPRTAPQLPTALGRGGSPSVTPTSPLHLPEPSVQSEADAWGLTLRTGLQEQQRRQEKRQDQTAHQPSGEHATAQGLLGTMAPGHTRPRKECPGF